MTLGVSDDFPTRQFLLIGGSMRPTSQVVKRITVEYAERLMTRAGCEVTRTDEFEDPLDGHAYVILSITLPADPENVHVDNMIKALEAVKDGAVKDPA